VVGMSVVVVACRWLGVAGQWFAPAADAGLEAVAESWDWTRLSSTAGGWRI